MEIVGLRWAPFDRHKKRFEVIMEWLRNSFLWPVDHQNFPQSHKNEWPNMEISAEGHVNEVIVMAAEPGSDLIGQRTRIKSYNRMKYSIN